MDSLGTVRALWVHPVASLRGESVDRLDLGADGFVDDRRLAVHEGESGRTLGAKRHPALLSLSARRNPAGVEVEFPGGETLPAPSVSLDRRLSELLGLRVTVRPDEEPFGQKRAVSLLTTSSIAALQEAYPGGAIDARRFRMNVVIETEGNNFRGEDWTGTKLRLGTSARVQVSGPCRRCEVTTLEQAELPLDPGVLETLELVNQGNLGMMGAVLSTGPVRVGDPVLAEVS